MRINQSVCLAVLLLATPVFADAPSTRPSQREALQRRLLALQSRIDQLSQKQTPSDIQVMDQIQADATRHSQLMSTVGVSGQYDPDLGFILQTDDGNYSIHPGILVQGRYVINERNAIYPNHGGVTGKVNDDTQSGFEITRFRLSFDGNVIGPGLTYFVQVAQDSSMSSLTLLDAYIMYRVSAQSPLAIKVGQFKDPLWHEQNLYESKLMAVDRTVASALVGGGELDRIQGVALLYDEDRLRGQLTFDDGIDGLNTPFYGPSGVAPPASAVNGVQPTDWGSTARIEYLVIGDRTAEFNPYSEYDQFTSRRASQDILVVGGGLEYTESGANSILFQTLDAQYNMVNGLSLYAAFLGDWRDYKTNRGVPPGHYYDDAFILQAAYLITPKIEPFVRYDYTHLAGDAQPGIIQDNLNEFTIGANYYLYGQHAKFTVDATWLPNGSPADIPYLDILRNNAHNEFLVRAQFQLAI
jgi:hypothetical protein